ncbi:hypothetical protein FDA94_31615 [Herbidospora galbida]|uniref:Uncharacterized protein n=1 Tax=Herbidospora galbida TaxID=2575442 RepID=A0A4U3M8K6_9ACTN|nr:S1C family serine protease [Herbidospora galbida]TKK83917.1 hypothetical protein FDA94_31615 [Herbidospora galbida]
MPRLAVIAGLGALGVLGMPLLHPHPSGSTDRVTPGAVRVESESTVSVTLIDDRARLQRFEREYEVELATGSGFTVTPDGVIVTATQVVRSDKDLQVYAANRVFAEYFKVDVPADFDRHTVDDPDLNIRLQACYPPRTQNSTCNATVETKVTAFPYLDPALPEGLAAEVLSAGDTPSAPAVLKVNAGPKNNLPTVPMGTTIGAEVESVDVMTLATRPSAKAPPKMDTAHFDPPGSRNFKAAERDKIDKLIEAGAIGAAVIDDRKSEVVGVLSGGGSLPATVTPVDEIRTALVAAGVTPRRGPVDVVYEQALAAYHNKLYANAAPVLQQVLTLRQDHAVALDYLRVSKAKANTAEDAAKKKPSPVAVPAPSPGVASWIWITGGVVLVGAVMAGSVPFLLRRRRNGVDQQDTSGENHALVTSWPAQTEVYRTPNPGQPVMDISPAGGQPHVSNPGSNPGGTSKKFCTQCGMRLGHAHRFCGFCGHPSDAP